MISQLRRSVIISLLDKILFFQSLSLSIKHLSSIGLELIQIKIQDFISRNRLNVN